MSHGRRGFGSTTRRALLYLAEMQPAPIRVLIVEDHQIFADALRLLLDRTEGIEVVGIAQDGGEAIDLACIADAQVVLMDIGLPRMNGLEATRRLLAIKPDARVIALTGQTEGDGKAAATAAGAVDFLTKGGIHDHVRDSIFRAMRAAGASRGDQESSPGLDA
jgi:DNA-binding NarL/FixJ family response regulator